MRNYKQLVQLYSEYRNRGFEIIAFPCNQFANGEQGSNQSITKFARDKLGAEFQLMSKVDVNGPDTHPVYQYLRSNSELYDTKKKMAGNVPWNFTKFLVVEDNGNEKIIYFNPRVDPLTLREQIEKHI